MNAHDKREKFTALLAGDRCVIAGSVFDPLSARIADEVGFEVGLLVSCPCWSTPTTVSAMR